MTPAEKFLLWLTQSWRVDMWMIGKGAIILLLIIFIIFALVVLKQIQLMSRAINGLAEKWLKWGAVALIGLTSGALLLAIIIL